MGVHLPMQPEVVTIPNLKVQVALRVNTWEAALSVAPLAYSFVSSVSTPGQTEHVRELAAVRKVGLYTLFVDIRNFLPSCSWAKSGTTVALWLRRMHGTRSCNIGLG
jgi:hypothetical protein